MKNNQFKKIVKQLIEEECKAFDFISVCNDESNNSRMIYIYTLEYRFVGMFRLWLTNERIHLSFTNLATLPLIQHKVKDVTVSYVDFHRINETITEAFDIMDKTEG